MAQPVVGQQNPRQVGVAHKLDSHQVEDLALVPIGGLPDGSELGSSGRRPGTSSYQRGSVIINTRRCLWTKLDR